MFSFDFRGYGPSVEQICQPDRQCDLGPGLPNQSMAAALGNLDAQALIGQQTIVDLDMVRCCISGLWLFQDFLDESHVFEPAGPHHHRQLLARHHAPPRARLFQFQILVP